jgi:hypothetical protein
MTDRQDQPPTPSAGDTLHTLVKAGLSAIPIVGGPAAELFAYIIAPPLTKRRDEWLLSISEGLKALERKVDKFSIESLQHNEAFVTMLIEASRIALRTHVNEKIQALRNAVLNAALESPDDLFQTMLLQFLEAATPWHLRVLAFYRDPESYASKAGLTLMTGDRLSHYVSLVFKELEGKDAFRLQIERDLLHHGLVYHEGEWYSKRTTHTGDRVLAMVSSPVE